MEKSYIPKVSEDRYCEGINLCSVRKTETGESKVGVKDLTGKISEDLLSKVINADTYDGKKIVRVYSSGHIFLNEDKVYLVTTEKNGKVQHQFTGGSPLEEENKEVIFKENGEYKFDLEKVKQNARIRTKNRTGVEVLEEYNKKPLVDWALMENEENGEVFYKLVCLMHFIVKKYKGELSYTDKEYVVGGKWYDIEKLPQTNDVALNAYIVTKKALELLEKQNKVVIISDFSKTLTSANNPTTWSVFERSGFLGEKYAEERNKYYDEYHKFELEGDVKKTKEWWIKHLELFCKYGLNKDLIDKVTKDIKYFHPRLGLGNFLKYLDNYNIELSIISSGVSDFVESFFKVHNISLDNISIFGNKLVFDKDGKVVGFDENSIITTLNKYDHNLDLEFYKKVVLLGDDKNDLKMYDGDCLRIGFCDNTVGNYDIYLGKDGSLEQVGKIINDIL